MLHSLEPVKTLIVARPEPWLLLASVSFVVGQACRMPASSEQQRVVNLVVNLIVSFALG